MFDFENQEPPPSHGRGNRQPMPTPGMIAFNQEQAKLNASRERRQAKKARQGPTTQLTMPPTPPPSVGRGHLAIHEPSSAATSTFLNTLHGNPIVHGVSDRPSEIRAEISEAENNEPEEALAGQLVPNASSRIASQPLVFTSPLQRRANSAGNMTPPPSRPFTGSPVNVAMPYVRKNLVRRGHLLPHEYRSQFVDPIISVVPAKRTHDEVDQGHDAESAVTSQITDDPEVQANLRRATMNPQRRRIFDLAVTKFRVKLLFVNAFPDSITAMKFASEAWYQAFNSLQITLNYLGLTNPTDEELDLIKTRSSQFRGQVVTIARNTTGPFYGLQKATDQAVINTNRETVSKLLNRFSFVYQNPDNREEPGTLFRSALIPLVLNVSCFNKKEHSEGLHDGTTTNFITLPSIALVVTAINCALDEWKTGIKVDGQFSAKLYEAIYQKHLKYLKDWEEYSSTRSRATDTLRNMLYHQALEHAGVFQQPLADVGGDELTVADFAANEA
ncbi:hypothetical protein ONZ45_g12953 [Pleurotus djamor]|nr:hypothetical protein ONZ45_g12953 [Pleurotus djamor]